MYTYLYTYSYGFLEGVQVYGCVVKMGFEEDVYIQNSLIYFYCECGEVDKGRKVFDEMSERNVVSWTSLICGFSRWGCAEEAVSLFFEMVGNGGRPNEVTMVCVISACTKLRKLDLGERVLSCIGELGLDENVVLVNAVVDMYMKCGTIDKARHAFRGCVGGNLGLYNTILSNYVHQRLVREVVPLLNKILRQGLKPDMITMLYTYMLSMQLQNWRIICLVKSVMGLGLVNLALPVNFITPEMEMPGVSVTASVRPLYPIMKSSAPSPEQYGGATASYKVPRPPLLPGSYVSGAYGPLLLPQGVMPVSNWSPYLGPISPVMSSGMQPSIGAASLYGVTPLFSSAPVFAGPYAPLPLSAGPLSNSQMERLFPE